MWILFYEFNNFLLCIIIKLNFSEREIMIMVIMNISQPLQINMPQIKIYKAINDVDSVNTESCQWYML